MEHMFLVLAAITMSILIGIPLGVCAYMMPKSRGLILKVVDILQTIPALALFAGKKQGQLCLLFQFVLVCNTSHILSFYN